MDRFLVFAHYRYEPGGGWRDFKSSHAYQYEAEAEARKAVTDFEHGESHVVDTHVNFEDSIVFEIDFHDIEREKELAAQVEAG